MRRLALVSLPLALAACATPGPEVPALVEIETVAPPSRLHALRIHLVTVSQDGSIERRSHHWRDEPARRTKPESLAPEQLRALRELLASPVAAEQPGVPLDTSQFRITVNGSPEWSLECYAMEVHRCPVAFLKLWQSLDEMIGDLPER
jgi:hypothetical protein